MSRKWVPAAVKQAAGTARRGGKLAQRGEILSPQEIKANGDAIEVFVKALGGRQAVSDALAFAEPGPNGELDQIVTLLLDPRYDRYPLRRLCGLANLTIVDLFAAYKKATLVRAHLEAYQHIAAHLVRVVEDVMRRAAPYEIPCGACAGSGSVRDAKHPNRQPTTCQACGGHGKLLQLPDLDRQKLALELGQLVARSAGVNVVQQTLAVSTASGAAASGTLEALQQAVGDLLSGARPPASEAPAVEAEIVEPAAAAAAAPAPTPSNGRRSRKGERRVKY